MSSSSRFLCPSASLSLNGLLRRTQRALWMGLVSAVGIHLTFTQLGGLSEEERVAKPLTTQFIKRQPRLTKPLELKKRPRPKQRTMRRKMVAVKAKVDRQEAVSSLRPIGMVQQLARPKVDIGRITAFQMTSLEPQVVAQAVESTKEAKSIIEIGRAHV